MHQCTKFRNNLTAMNERFCFCESANVQHQKQFRIKDGTFSDIKVSVPWFQARCSSEKTSSLQFMELENFLIVGAGDWDNPLDQKNIPPYKN